LQTGKSQLDKVLNLDEKEIIVNRIPIITHGKVTGVVSSFRDKDELDILAKKLSQVQKYSEMLRAQTHEYSNKLHTISGLIQIGAHQEAIELIGSETSGYQNLINSLMSIVPEPIIAGTILGKYNKARELKIELTIDPDSSMSDIPSSIKRGNLVTIIGNILDNGFEAVLMKAPGERKVHVSMTDLGNDLIFDFDDSGHGLAEHQWDNIFTKGYTTKDSEGHGMGLYLVEKTVRRMGGTVSVGSSELGGAAFTVIIPKTENSPDGKRHD
jgi:sensor histidine kinase regulating citrate/malate metabolism